MTLDALLLEADRIGLRLRVEAGRVKVKLLGPSDAGVEELLAALRPFRDELAARLAERDAPAPPVVVLDRRASEAAPMLPPEVPVPASVILSSRSFTDGEVARASGSLPVRVGRPLDSLSDVLDTAETFRRAKALGYVS